MRTAAFLLFITARVASSQPVIHMISSTTGSRGALNAAIARCNAAPRVRREFSRALIAVAAEGLSEEQLACTSGNADLLIEQDIPFTAFDDALSWGLDRIDQERGLDSHYTGDTEVTGTEVHAFVLDTGI